MQHKDTKQITPSLLITLHAGLFRLNMEMHYFISKYDHEFPCKLKHTVILLILISNCELSKSCNESKYALNPTSSTMMLTISNSA